MSGNGTYLDSNKKIGKTKIKPKSEQELREGLERELANLKANPQDYSYNTPQAQGGIDYQEKQKAKNQADLTIQMNLYVDDTEYDTVNGVPLSWINLLAKITDMGASKHGRNSYLRPGVLERDQNYRCITAHAAKMAFGDKVDNESGLHHGGHVAWRALAQFEIDDKEI